MKSVDPGVYPQSTCFSFTPSEVAREYYYYLLWCGHYFCSSRYFMKRETYPYLLVAYVVRSEFHFVYRGESFTAKRGDAVLIDCTEPHYYYASDGLEFRYIHFDGGNAHSLVHHIMEHYGVHFTGEKAAAIGKIIQEIVNAYEKSTPPSLTEISAKIYNLLIAATVTTQVNGEPSPVDVAITYIRDNVGKKITLEELAELTSLSPFYLSHIFKDQTGYSPIDYVIVTRLDQAKVLLIRTNLSISEISYQVGYDNSGSFTNIFKKREGIAPKDFRKREAPSRQNFILRQS